MRRLIWSDEATANVLAIGVHYDAIDPDLSDRLLDEIARSPGVLLEQPEAGPSIDANGLRKWRVRSRPFVILYRAYDDRIEVVRVHHVRENWRA